jgi:homoserine O-acetyltransferase
MPPATSTATPATREQVSGAWQIGDPIADRKFAALGALTLESGIELLDVTLAYETWGTFKGNNAVLVLHALTGDAHAAGEAGPGQPTAGWWDALIGPGKSIDTDRYFVVSANILGGCQGSTGPASLASNGSPWGSRFPRLTVRDQVKAEALLARELGISSWHTVVGGSAGGMRALEWAIGFPSKVHRLLVVATTAWSSAEQIALTETQAAAIRADANFHGGDYYGDDRGPVDGLDVARRIAQISYRSERELEQRFGRDRSPADGEPWAVDSYLQHHGEKLTRRFDANSYIVLGDAMNSHDVGRGRGGVGLALNRITARTIVAGIDSDRLYPLFQQQLLAEQIPRSRRLDIIKSLHGHDGFLIEHDQVGGLIDRLLN